MLVIGRVICNEEDGGVADFRGCKCGDVIEVNYFPEFEGASPLILGSVGKVCREVEIIGGRFWVAKVCPGVSEMFVFIIEGVGITEHRCAGSEVKSKVSRVEFGLGGKA